MHDVSIRTRNCVPNSVSQIIGCIRVGFTRELLRFGRSPRQAGEVRGDRRCARVTRSYAILLIGIVGQFVDSYGNMRRYDPLACRKKREALYAAPGIRKRIGRVRDAYAPRWSREPLRMLHPTIFRCL
jgi:hypothetical protein